MGSIYRGAVGISIFGQSHGAAVGVVIDALPAGFKLNIAALRAFMSRRAPGGELSSARREADDFEIISGLKDGYTCGAPLCAIIENKDARAADYAPIADLPRPGHADFTARVKYGAHADLSGGGHLSGRLTAPLCLAGGIFMQMLAEHGVSITARVTRVGKATGGGAATNYELDKPVNADLSPEMRAEIEAARADGTSVGGEIECAITGIEAGLGEPIFDGVENVISHCAFAIPGVKAIEFGAGFEFARGRGDMNDEFILRRGEIATATNNCGGILGGISNGMPIIFRVAVKPTPSVAAARRTVNMRTLEETEISARGRHDPCIAPRATPCVEAAAAIAIFDLYMKKHGGSIWN